MKQAGLADSIDERLVTVRIQLSGVGLQRTFSNDTIHISIQGRRYDTGYDTLLCATKLVT